MNTGFVYRIVNDVNNKVYVGSTAQTLSQRMAEHRSNHQSGKLFVYQDMQQFGIDHFRIELLEVVNWTLKEQLRQRESLWIDALKARDPEFGYNKGRSSNVTGKYLQREDWRNGKDNMYALQKKDYYERKGDVIRENNAQYYAKNIAEERFKCIDCGQCFAADANLQRHYSRKTPCCEVNKKKRAEKLMEILNKPFVI